MLKSRAFLSLLFILNLIFSSILEASEDRASIQMEYIDSLTLQLEFDENAHPRTISNLRNTRAIAYLYAEEFDLALNDFNHVLESQDLLIEEMDIGLALWGRLLCHAFENNTEEAYADCQLIRTLFINCDCCHADGKNERVLQSRGTAIVPIAKFVYPQERISKWECHDRTSNIADKMRSLVDYIDSWIIRKLVLELIDELASRGHKCCERGNDWTECLGPIADAWKKLEDTWDRLEEIFKRGLNIKSFLTIPNGL